MKLCLLLLLAALVSVAAFSPRHVLPSSSIRVRSALQPLKAVDPTHIDMGMEGASMLLSILKRVPDSEARGAFFFFFFAGSGALGIGGAQIPKLLEEYKEIAKLAGGPSNGGEDLSLNFAQSFGYPEPIKVRLSLSLRVCLFLYTVGIFSYRVVH